MKVKQFMAFVSLAIFGTAAYAMPAAGAGALPWDAPLATLVTSITGPFAFAAATVGMVIAGAILVFGNDLNRFGQSIMYLILVIGLIILGVNGMAALFATGAVIGTSSTLVVASTGALLAAGVWLTGVQYFLVKAIKSLLKKPISTNAVAA